MELEWQQLPGSSGSSFVPSASVAVTGSTSSVDDSSATAKVQCKLTRQASIVEDEDSQFHSALQFKVTIVKEQCRSVVDLFHNCTVVMSVGFAVIGQPC